MIANDHELNASLERIRHLQTQVATLRQVETNPVNYHRSAAGFLAEIDRMHRLPFSRSRHVVRGPSQMIFARAARRRPLSSASR